LLRLSDGAGLQRNPYARVTHDPRDRDVAWLDDGGM